MMTFIHKNKIITSSQYGFQSNKSTESALIDFIEYIHEGLTKKSHVGAVFMDLSKAFDVMTHDILKQKLEHYGFRGTFLTLLMNFIKDRKYFVYANGYKSGVKIVNIGVPQGQGWQKLIFSRKNQNNRFFYIYQIFLISIGFFLFFLKFTSL